MTEVIYRCPTELKSHPDNPRKLKPNGIIELAKSLEANPDYFEARPILLSDRTGELVIIDGEQRWHAAMYLGMAQVPTITMRELTLEREHEIINRANTHVADWDVAKLKDKWTTGQLQEWGIDRKVWKEPKAKEPNVPFIYIRCNGENLTLNGKIFHPGMYIDIDELKKALWERREDRENTAKNAH